MVWLHCGRRQLQMQSYMAHPGPTGAGGDR